MADKLKRAGRRSRAIACESRPSSPCSARSSMPEASASSCCAASNKVRAEWAMICTAHNLLKLANASR